MGPDDWQDKAVEAWSDMDWAMYAVDKDDEREARRAARNA